MLTFRKNITHIKQGGEPNCGPIALQCVFDEPISRLEKIVKCKQSGTNSFDVVSGLTNEGVVCNRVALDGEYQDHLWWIATCCLRWPIYASCTFINQGKRGRPRHDHHAVLFANGFCYDGHADREEPIDSMSLKFNKNMIISNIIIIEHELPNWRQTLETS